MKNIKVYPASSEAAKETPKRIIKNPWWGNDEKTIIRCQFYMENGEVLEASVSDTEEGNPDWYEIMETFGVEDIDKRTQAFMDEHEEQHRKEKERRKDQEEKYKGHSLFAAKLEAFEMDLIKNSKNREFKSMIRKAKSIMEVTAYTTILIMKELEIETKE